MSRTILIIGDSWGVPNYSKGWDTPPSAHTEFRLKNLGYNVLNCSLNGGSNLETIEYAKALLSKQELSKHPLYNIWKHKRNTYAMSNGELEEVPVPNYRGEKIDWILWFHTEAIRDMGSFHLNYVLPFTKIYDIHNFYKIIAYRSFQSLVNLCPGVKTAVIGGQSLIDKEFYECHTPNFIIEDWRSEIVGEKLPYCVTLSRLDMVNSSLGTTDEKMSILDAHQKIFNAMLDLDLFFDRCHPASKPHEALTQKLHILFQST